MAQAFDLEAIREVFKDRRVHLALGRITQLSLSSDRSCLMVMVSIFPDEQEIVARMTWESVGADAGIFSFPVAGDLVLVAFAEGDYNQALVIKRLTSAVDKIPVNAGSGDTVVKALSGKNTWITGQRVNLTKGDTAPTEPVPLGLVLVSLLSYVLDELSTMANSIALHTHVTSAPGAPTSVPIQAADFITNDSHFAAKKASPVDDHAVLSDVSFTEKG